MFYIIYKNNNNNDNDNKFTFIYYIYIKYIHSSGIKSSQLVCDNLINFRGELHCLTNSGSPVFIPI